MSDDGFDPEPIIEDLSAQISEAIASLTLDDAIEVIERLAYEVDSIQSGLEVDRKRQR